MFDQSFINAGGRTLKPVSIGLSFLIQCVGVALFVLLSILFTQTLPSAQLKCLLLAPRAPVTAPPATEKPRPSGPSTALRNRLILLTPTPVSLSYHAPARFDPAPGEVDFGPSASNGSFPAGVIGAQGDQVPPPPEPRVTPPKQTASIQRISSGVAAANLLYKVTPEYPRLAVIARVQGSVHFRAVIGEEGRIEELQVTSGSPLLVKAAQDAVLQWRYRPTLLSGVPVNVVTEIDVNFTLNN